MRIIVESLKRLYANKSLAITQIEERVAKGSITADEYEYITGEAYTNESA